MLLFFVSSDKRPHADRPAKDIVCLDTISKARALGFRSFAILAQFGILKYICRKPFIIYTVTQNNERIHYVLVFGRTWRFPFMGKDDLCVAYAWTSPHHRNKGFFSATLKRILCDFGNSRIWIFADPSNAPSLRCFKKAGFEYAGKGRLTKPLGSGILGRYIIEGSS